MVGLIPFEMRDVQLGPTPPVLWLGTFIEINVRTYLAVEVGWIQNVPTQEAQ